jgi:3-hydroxyacyl-[acyl-carrier-protein] dehydratase
MEPLDIQQIEKILPQRYPFLFIDKALELELGKRVVAIKNVSINEYYFQGHFPANPIMPGVLIIEAMTQASILLYYSAYQDKLAKIPAYYLGSVKAKFKHPVFPGSQLKLESKTVKLLPTGAFIEAKASVEGKEVAEAELIFAVKS